MSKSKRRLLDSALIEFASHGYAGAKIASIIGRAETNIAAVNYHFGSKDELFRLVLREAFAIADAKYPIRKAEDQDPETALKTFMGAFIRRALDPDEAGYFNAIMCKSSQAEDTPHRLIFEEVEQLELRHLRQILSQLLPQADAETLRFASLNVISQSIVLSMNPRMREQLFPTPPDSSAIAAFINRQSTGTLAFLQTLQAS